MEQTRIRALWAAGKPVVNGWLSIPSTVTAEINARAGFDSLTVDLQHGLNDYQSALNLLQTISIGASAPMARVPWLEPGIVGKLLDAGAVGLICPMINSAQDAADHGRTAARFALCARLNHFERVYDAHAGDRSHERRTQVLPQRSGARGGGVGKAERALGGRVPSEEHGRARAVAHGGPRGAAVQRDEPVRGGARGRRRLGRCLRADFESVHRMEDDLADADDRP